MHFAIVTLFLLVVGGSPTHAAPASGGQAASPMVPPMSPMTLQTLNRTTQGIGISEPVPLKENFNSTENQLLNFLTQILNKLNVAEATMAASNSIYNGIGTTTSPNDAIVTTTTIPDRTSTEIPNKTECQSNNNKLEFSGWLYYTSAAFVGIFGGLGFYEALKYMVKNKICKNTETVRQVPPAS